MSNRVSMTPKGHFGQLLADAVQRKGLSLHDLSEQLGITYEHARKLWCNIASPSDDLIRKAAKRLDMDAEAAVEAATQDRVERKHGQAGLKALGRDPRLGRLDAVTAVLTDSELETLVAVAQSLIRTRDQLKLKLS